MRTKKKLLVGVESLSCTAETVEKSGSMRQKSRMEASRKTAFLRQLRLWSELNSLVRIFVVGSAKGMIGSQLLIVWILNINYSPSIERLLTT